MSAFADLVRFLPVAGGTTDWVVSTAVGGCQLPSAANVQNGVSYKLYAVSTDLTQWEVVISVYNSGTTTFPRTTVLYNSSGTGTATGQSGAGTKINFSTIPQVSVVALAEDMVPQTQGHIPGEASTGTAASGEIGESSNNSGSGNFTTTGTPQMMTSITVPAGDFELMGVVVFSGTGSTTSTDVTSIISATSTPSVAGGNAIDGLSYHQRTPSGLDYFRINTHMPWRVSNASPTIYYFHGSAAFAVSTYGFQAVLKYRRAR